MHADVNSVSHYKYQNNLGTYIRQAVKCPHFNGTCPTRYLGSSVAKAPNCTFKHANNVGHPVIVKVIIIIIIKIIKIILILLLLLMIKIVTIIIIIIIIIYDHH